MTIHQIKAPCWTVSPRLPREDSDPHYDSRAEALTAIREAWDFDRDWTFDDQLRVWWREFRFRLSRLRPGAPRPRRHDDRCWVVQDDGDCGQILDEEDEGYIVHCDSRRAAEDLARSWEWAYSADRRSVYCPCCSPGDAEPIPPTPRELEAAGQLVLPGVLP